MNAAFISAFDETLILLTHWTIFSQTSFSMYIPNEYLFSFITSNVKNERDPPLSRRFSAYNFLHSNFWEKNPTYGQNGDFKYDNLDKITLLTVQNTTTN